MTSTKPADELEELRRQVNAEPRQKLPNVIQKPAPKPIKPKEPKEKDLFRDTPVRYLGYANEVGEAFRAHIGANWVRLTYAVACAYVCCDANDKKNKADLKDWASPEESQRQKKHAIIDTLLWQGFASVIIPGFTINRFCWLTNRLILESVPMTPLRLRKGIVSFMGLCAIPFIIKPIDRSVDWAMEGTYRKYTQVHAADSSVHHTRTE